MKNLKTAQGGNRPAGRRPPPPAPAAPAPVAPLFRRIDWLILVITFVVMWVVYFLTLAPELTLEDSGELVTGSFYAGIPHPPGYPVWTIYSWLWTVLVPVGNIAWRVALAEAAAGALACGLIALMVSRGSSLLMESIPALQAMTGKWESAICMVSGLVAGLLMGLDDFMWRESVAVNRIAVSSVPWFMLVLLCLLRWLYAPHQYRFLYWALFLFGICFTTHQSLIVAALGIEVLIAAVNPRLGRDAFLGNGVVYLVDLVVVATTGEHIFHNIGARSGLLLIFNVIGLGSLITAGWLAVRTKGLLSEWKPVVLMGLLWILGFSFYFYMPLAGMTNPPMQWAYPRTVDGFFHALTRGQYDQPNPTNILVEPGRFIGQLYMLISSVGDSFTLVCVLVALVPFAFFFKLQKREQAWLIGLSALYLCLGVLLVILLNPTPDRSSTDLVKVFFNNSHTVVAGLIGYGLALTAAYMATHYHQFRLWGIAGGTVAVVLAIYSLSKATGEHFFGPAGHVDLWDLPRWIGQAFAKNQYGLPVYANLLLVAISFAFVCALVVYRRRAPLAITLGLFAMIPLYSGLSRWFECDQRNHMFGYWFGHDMFKPPFKGKDGQPLFPEMTKDAILFGGTDPGRFCPTYMIFCESFTPHDCQPAEDQRFDRRDVYIITQNALADAPYLNYIRAHYNRSTQIDPPFFSEFVRRMFKDKEGETNLLARAVGPLDWVFTRLGDRVEKQRRTYTSWFTEKDFNDLPGFAAKLRPGPTQDPLSKYLYENLNAPTRQLLADKSDEELLRRRLVEDLNRLLDRELQVKKRIAEKKARKDPLDEEIAFGNPSAGQRRRQEQLAKEIAELASIGPLYEPDRFKQVQLSAYLADFIRENPQSHTRIRLNRLLLEAAYPKEIAGSLGGVYPDREIYTPTPEDLRRETEAYTIDAQRRYLHDEQFPNEPRQVRQGEDVRRVGDRIQIFGTIAVMNINGLLTKVIFDHNPKNEFFVEESLPLDWMYPYLTPYGIIMKINRQPLPSLPVEALQKDHEFWKQYSKRLTGDIIDYDTPMKQVTDWIEKTYVRYNLNGFTGDRKFIHDMDAQKSFSKLRGAIAGMYAWRLNPQIPPEYRPKSVEEAQRLFKEADFAYRQSFAFCPFSPEAAVRYINLLLPAGRLDDALLVVETWYKLDPYNGQAQGLVETLRGFKKQQGAQGAKP